MYNCCILKTMKSQGQAKLIDLGRHEITIEGRLIIYTLRRSQRARLIWLNIRRETGLIVTVPPQYDIDQISDYLALNSAWIIRNLNKYCPVKEDQLEKPEYLESPSYTIRYLGKNLKVMQQKTFLENPSITIKNDRLIVNVCRLEKQQSIVQLENWLKAQAVNLIYKKTLILSQKMGVVFNKIKIRDQKSRWGSCSCRKNLNFNWRLIMAPEPVLEYVIIHELCHIIEMSHSSLFWSLVSRYCPKWKEYRDWLDAHGHELYACI